MWHDPQQLKHVHPEALGSPSGYVVPTGHRLLRPPHELPRLVRCEGRLRGGCFWLECWTTPTISPDPKYREPMPEDLVTQRCAWPRACRAMATASIDSPTAWAAD